MRLSDAVDSESSRFDLMLLQQHSPQTEDSMANVYVEPEPRGRPEGSPITHYVLEYAHGARVTNVNYSTQAAAVTAAKQAGHRPLIARVRNTDKGNPDHWRAA